MKKGFTPVPECHVRKCVPAYRQGRDEWLGGWCSVWGFAFRKKKPRTLVCGGFTFIELTMVVGIMLLLVALGSPVYRDLMMSIQVNENVSLIKQTLRIARARSVAGLNNAKHGVYFDINAGAADEMILYQGSSYASRDSGYDLVTTFDPSLGLSTTLTGDEVNFAKGSGLPDDTGIVTLTHEASGSDSVTVNVWGMVD